MRSKINMYYLRGLPKKLMDKSKISILEMVLGAPDRVPCLMHDTSLCQIDIKMTNN